jgi:hypothetical protein
MRFPLAERPVSHMRMDDRVVRGRRMRVHREYLVTGRAFVEAFIVQDDFEAAEVYVFKLNWSSDDCELTRFEADSNLGELVSQADDVFIYIS